MLARRKFKLQGINDNKVVVLVTNTTRNVGKYRTIAEAKKLKKQGKKLVVLLFKWLLSFRLIPSCFLFCN